MVDFYNQNPFMQNPFLPGQVAGVIAPGGQIPGMPGAAPVPPQAAPPFTPAPPRQAPGAAPMQLQPQQTSLSRAMNSPWAAMASAGMNNLMAGLRNQPAQQDPFAAYQAAVARNAELALRQRAEDRAQRTADQEADPFFEYEEARRRGLIPQDMTLQEYQRTVQASGSNRPVKTWTGENGNMMYLDSNGNVVDTGVKGSPPGTEIVDRGGVPYVQETLPGGEIRMMPLDKWQELYRTETIESEAGAGEAGKQGAQYDAEQVSEATGRIWDNQEAYRMAQEMRDVSQEFQTRLANNEIDTGLVQGWWMRTFGRGPAELAELEAESVMAVLKNLGITNLAPVTVQELQTVARLWADIMSSEEVNEGTLKRAIARSERLMGNIQQDTLDQINRIGEYGGEARQQSLLRSNPWARGFWEEEQAKDEDTGGSTVTVTAEDLRGG